MAVAVAVAARRDLGYLGPMRTAIDSIYRRGSRRGYARLVRLPGSLHAADVALHHAFEAIPLQMCNLGWPASLAQLATRVEPELAG